MLSGIPFDGPDRRRAPGLQPATARGSRTPPTKRATSPRFEIVVAGRAGRRRRRHHDGRGRRHREGLELLRGRRPQGHRGGHRRGPRGVQDLDPRVDRPAARARRPRPACTRRSPGVASSTTATTSRARSPRSPRAAWPRPTPSPTRPSATRPTTRSRPTSSAELTATARSSTAASSEIKAAVRSLTKKVIRKRIVNEGVRIDGRGTADLRPVVRRGRRLPTAHGSGLFQRGETQVLNVATLGMPRMDQMLDTLGAEDQEALHAPLQHAALLQRRDRPHGWPEAPRDRPRPARRAGAAAGRAEPRGVPLHAPPRVRGAVVERLHLDGLGVRRRRCR